MKRKKNKSELQKQFEKQRKRIKETIRRYKKKNIFIEYEIPEYKRIRKKNIETLSKVNIETLIKKNKVFFADIETGEYKKLTPYLLEKMRSENIRKRKREEVNYDFYDDYDYPSPTKISDTVLTNVENILKDARNIEVANYILNAIEEEINDSSREEVALRLETYGNIYCCQAADDAGNASTGDDIRDGFMKLMEIIRDGEPFESDTDFITEQLQENPYERHRNYYNHQFHTGRRK